MGLDAGADFARAIEQRNGSIGLPPGLHTMGVRPEMIADRVPHALADKVGITAS